MLTNIFDEQLERENYEATKDKEMIAEGIENGNNNTLIDLVKQNLFSIESPANSTKMTAAEFVSLPEIEKT